VKRAIPSAGLEIPAGGDDFRLQGVITLPGHLTKIGGATGSNEGLQLHVAPLAHDLDLEIAAAGSPYPVVRGAARRRGARIISLQYRKASSHKGQDLSDRLVVLDHLKPVGAQLAGLRSAGGDRRR
jgi:hypothetical protein